MSPAPNVPPGLMNNLNAALGVNGIGKGRSNGPAFGEATGRGYERGRFSAHVDGGFGGVDEQEGLVRAQQKAIYARMNPGGDVNARQVFAAPPPADVAPPVATPAPSPVSVTPPSSSSNWTGSYMNKEKQLGVDILDDLVISKPLAPTPSPTLSKPLAPTPKSNSSGLDPELVATITRMQSEMAARQAALAAERKAANQPKSPVITTSMTAQDRIRANLAASAATRKGII